MVQQPPTGNNCKYIQSALLNLSTVDKQYDVVIFNPNNYKENMKLHIHIPCTLTFIIHICTQIYINKVQGIFLKTNLFIFNIRNNSFHYRVISLLQKGIFYNEHSLFTT